MNINLGPGQIIAIAVIIAVVAQLLGMVTIPILLYIVALAVARLV